MVEKRRITFAEKSLQTPRHLHPNSNFRAFVIFSPSAMAQFLWNLNNTKSF
jgi:hypothetical protein